MKTYMTMQESIDAFCEHHNFIGTGTKLDFVNAQWGMFVSWLREQYPREIVQTPSSREWCAAYRDRGDDAELSELQEMLEQACSILSRLDTSCIYNHDHLADPSACESHN